MLTQQLVIGLYNMQYGHKMSQFLYILKDLTKIRIYNKQFGSILLNKNH